MENNKDICGRDSNMDKVKVVLVGCGYIADGHLRSWKKLNNAEVVSVVDINESAAENAAKKWNIPSYSSSLKDLLSKGDVDVVDICTPPHTHAPIAVEAMEAGSNIILEKPMTMNIEDADRILSCWKRTGVKAGVIHNWLFEPPVPDVRALVDEGVLGEIHHVDLKALNTKADWMAINGKHWCHRLEGGRFGEMLAHPIYLIKHFMKDVSLQNISVSKIGEYDWMKSDELIASFRADNKFGTFYASFNSPRQAIYLSLYGEKAIVQLDLINVTVNVLPERGLSKGSVGYDYLRQTSQLSKYMIKNVGKVVTNQWMTGHDLYIKQYAESMFDDSDPPVSIIDGHNTIKILVEMIKEVELQEKNDAV